MNTSILTVIFAGALLAGQNGPKWTENYAQAQQKGAQQGKPLAVVFGTGANGWSKLVRDGEPGAASKQLLADRYVCVYVDTTTKAGRDLARSFAITGDTGLVISDGTGRVQAFWHQGDMTSKNLLVTLDKFSDPQRPVQTTETGTVTRTSFYQTPNADGTPSLVLPGQSSYCPTCNGGGSFRRR